MIRMAVKFSLVCCKKSNGKRRQHSQTKSGLNYFSLSNCKVNMLANGALDYSLRASNVVKTSFGLLFKEEQTI